MRVAVIGCGSIGRRHIANLLTLGCDVGVHDVSLGAVHRVMREHSVSVIADLFGGLASYDAVVIAPPAEAHLLWVEQAIRAGKPFFVEKPLGTLEQLPEWRELASRRDLPVNQVGYMLRFHRQARALRDLTPGATGGVFGIRCDKTTWPGQRYASTLLECSHEIDLALWCGAPPKVRLVTGWDRELEVWLGDQWCVLITDTDQQYRRSWAISSPYASGRCRLNSPEALGTLMYLDELSHFLQSVRTRTPTACSLADGLATLEVCGQIQSRMKQVA